MTARPIIAKGCVHLPRGVVPPALPVRPADPARPHASCAQVVRVTPSHRASADGDGHGRPVPRDGAHASTSVVRWTVTHG